MIARIGPAEIEVETLVAEDFHPAVIEAEQVQHGGASQHVVAGRATSNCWPNVFVDPLTPPAHWEPAIMGGVRPDG
jgi:hypothetical protein